MSMVLIQKLCRLEKHIETTQELGRKFFNFSVHQIAILLNNLLLTLSRLNKSFTEANLRSYLRL